MIPEETESSYYGPEITSISESFYKQPWSLVGHWKAFTVHIFAAKSFQKDWDRVWSFHCLRRFPDTFCLTIVSLKKIMFVSVFRIKVFLDTSLRKKTPTAFELGLVELKKMTKKIDFLKFLSVCLWIYRETTKFLLQCRNKLLNEKPTKPELSWSAFYLWQSWVLSWTVIGYL